MKTTPRIIISLVGALLLLVLSYAQFNSPKPGPLGNEKKIIATADRLKLSPKQHVSYDDSIVMIDVHYDKTLLPVYDSTGYCLGTTPITDRGKILALLRQLQQSNYRYIIMDVFFEQGDVTPYDSALFALIDDMDRIIIPIHNFARQNSLIPIEKTGLADYETTKKESSFLKFPYIVGSTASIPLKMYQQLGPNHSTIQRHSGLFYTDAGHLCRRSVFLVMDMAKMLTEYDGEDNYYIANADRYTLGYDALGMPPDTNEMAFPLLDTRSYDGKYVIIGDFEDDVHNTYRGSQPGPLILFNAFLALLHGQHHVSILFLLILYVIYTILFWILLGKQKLKDSLVRGIRNPVVKRLTATIVSLISYTLLLEVVCVITYWRTGKVYDLITIGAIFTILSNIYHYTYDVVQIQKNKLL